MAAEGATSSSPSSADTYIGSLISLTSKSEIRYEGVLYTINTEESSIGLRNVRSYGSEGRKKDGPQVPAGDKVYEYILFRGSDIKDLQVKSSLPAQPVQPTPPINNDPAIIQSRYPQPSSTSTTFPSTFPGPLADTGSITTQMGLPGSNFQGGLPMYHPGVSLGSWGPSPAPPGANANGVAMPMYYQGFYGPPNGIPQLHQQSLFRPPTGLSMSHSMQQPMQYPGFNTSLSTGPSNFLQSNLPALPPSLQNPGTSSVNLTTTSILPSTLQSSVPTVPSSAPETFSNLHSNLMQNKAPISAPVTAPLFQLSTLATSGPDVNVVVPQIPNSLKADSVPNMPYQTMPQSVSSFLGTSNSSRSEAPTPSLVTPGQLLKSEPTPVPSSLALQVDQKDVEVVKVSSTAEPSAAVSTEAQPPILPLPTPSRAAPKVNETSSPARQGYRGSESHGYRGRESHGSRVSENHGYRGGERGRGRGMAGSRPAVKFTEEFDFMAMNEKFNKDEVWGDLGKNNRSSLKDKDGNGNFSEENDYQEDDDSESQVKAVYSKDNFFDTISCNALNRESNNGRTKFSEQMKIDTETFGEFSRYRGGRGGRGFNRGAGRHHGGYYGRGYGGYNSRGRGRGYSNQAIN